MAAVCRLPGAIHPAASHRHAITMAQGRFSHVPLSFEDVGASACFRPPPRTIVAPYADFEKKPTYIRV